MTPRPRMAHSSDEHKRQEQQYADAHVETYHREMHEGPWPAYRRRLEEMLARHAGRPGRVLDVGAGPVPSLLGVLRGAERYVAVDQSPECVRRMARDFPRVEALQGDAEVLDVAGPFDLVLMLGVLHHLPDPARALHRAWELLVPGGWLVCMEPNDRTEAFMDSPNEQGITDDAFDALFTGFEVLERWAWFDVAFWSRVLASGASPPWEAPDAWADLVETEIAECRRSGVGSMNFAIVRRR